MFNKSLKEKNIPFATILAFTLVPLSGVATDIFIPSLPGMAADLHTTEGVIRMSITVFLLSYGLSQFISGAFIDALGRYRITLLMLGIFGLSSFGVVFTDSVALVLAARVAQGICAGTIAASKRTFIVDVYEDEKLKHYLSIMSIVWSIGPIIAPFIGGYLDHLFNWRSTFVFLGVYALVILVLEMIYSGETIKFYHAFKPTPILQKSAEMLRDSSFLYGIFLLGICYGMVILFGLVAPFLLEHKMGLSTVMTGYISLFMGFAWMVGGFLGKLLINKEFFFKIRIANYVQMCVALAMVLTATLWGNIYTIILFAFLIHICAGFIFNNYFAFCLARFPKMAGLSGGLTGGLTYILCSIFSYGIVWLLNPGSQQTLGEAYLILAFIMFLILTLLFFKIKIQLTKN